MLTALMRLSLRERIVILFLAVGLLVGGLYVFHDLDIEAYPDPVQPMVEVLTLPAGLSAQEVEKLVTVPLELGVAGMRGLEQLTSTTMFGLSDVKCYFSWTSDYYWDRTEVVNRLTFVNLPLNLTPMISPENPVGEIYRYIVESDDHNLLREREVQDWILEKQLKTIPGVIGVVGFGGLTKQYHVDVDPQRLDYYNVPLSALIGALRNSNTNVGGNYLTVGEQTFDVRGIGFFRGLEDIRDVVLSATRAVPIIVGKVATVDLGHAPRLGVVGINGRSDVVEGIVVMRKYGNTMQTLRGVEAKVAQLNSSGMLPAGYRIAPYYDRAALVNLTVRTVTENLSMGMVLVFLVLLFFLAAPVASVVAAINIPLALLGAITWMWLTGTPANLISLGAIDFGIIIDSTVIVVENIHRHLRSDAEASGNKMAVILRAGEEVGGPMFFSTLIFVIAFLPLFTMRGVAGAIFSPMSHVYAYSLAAGVLLAVTLSPALSSFVLRPGAGGWRNPAWEALQRAYHRLFVLVLSWPKLSLGLMGLVIALGLAQFPRLGGEFLPHLEEGNILVHATLPVSISLQHGAQMVEKMRLLLRAFPESGTVVSQFGRPDDGTDPVGFESADLLMELKPRAQWRPGLDKEELVNQIDDALRRQFPALNFDYTQFVEDRVEDVVSGIRGANSVKVFGPNLRTDEAIANRVREVLQKVNGIADVIVNRSLGKPQFVIKPDRAACSRYGLNVGDVAAVIRAAVGGQAVTQVLQGDRSFDLVVRFLPQYRDNSEALRQIRIALPGGGFVPLAQVAHIASGEGSALIYRESMRRYIPVSFAVRGRDLQSAVEAAKRGVAKELKLPPEVHLDWSGEYGEWQAAKRRLMIIVPLSVLLIVGVLYSATLSLLDTLIIIAQIPVACLGGILALIITGFPFSVSAAVGFVSIFGIAVTDGILLSFYIRQLWEEGHPFVESIIMGSDRRFRAVVMTALVDALGLLPAALSQKIGAQPQKPLAIVVIGGALAIAALTRLLQPVMIYLFHRGTRLGEQGPAGRGASGNNRPGIAPG
jgi:cobalt-zinc-cadmium resistance protein CzcA